jgi:uncharacterized protein
MFETTILYLPAGQRELDLIAATGYRAFPRRLPDQPIFYPVLTETYATQIAWMLEIGAVFIRTETELILKSRRVVPRRLQEAGFSFLFPAWAEAARDLCMRWRATNR